MNAAVAWFTSLPGHTRILWYLAAYYAGVFLLITALKP